MALSLLDKSSTFFLDGGLTLKEQLQLLSVSKGFAINLQHVPHLFSSIDLEFAWKLNDSGLKTLIRLAGSQLRSIKISYCREITGNAFSNLVKAPSLHTLSIHQCENVNVDQLMEVFLMGRYLDSDSIPSLTTVSLNGCSGLIPAHLDKLYQLGIKNIDQFECSSCAKISTVQHQCQYKGCNPSTYVLCDACANTKFCFSQNCNAFGCAAEDCTSNYAEWIRCGDCGNGACESCAETGENDLMYCDSCLTFFCDCCCTVSTCEDCGNIFCGEGDCISCGYCDFCDEMYCGQGGCTEVLMCYCCDETSCGKDTCMAMVYCERCDAYVCWECTNETLFTCADCKTTMCGIGEPCTGELCKGCSQYHCHDCMTTRNDTDEMLQSVNNSVGLTGFMGV